MTNILQRIQDAYSLNNLATLYTLMDDLMDGIHNGTIVELSKKTTEKLNRLKNNKIIIFVAPSASGKDKIASYFSEHYGYKFVVSHTSRPPRPDETENNPYHFISRNKFEQMIDNNELIEFRKYETLVNNIPNTWFYGVHKDSINLEENSYIVVLDIVGLKAFKQEYGDKVISFYIKVDSSEREFRAKRRYGYDETEWQRRLKDDEQVFDYFTVKANCDYIVQNYNFDKCIQDIINDIKEYEVEHE
jgi:guanylate kinase